jgi:hypothetical protein
MLPYPVLGYRRLATAAVVLVMGCTPPSSAKPDVIAPPQSPAHAEPTTGEPAPAARPLEIGLGQSITLDDGTVVVVEQIVVESIEASPDDPRSYPAGTGATVVITVAGHRAELTKLSPPYPSVTVAWLHGVRIELHDTDGKIARVSLQRVTDRVLATESLRISKGERVRLHGTHDFTFVGHSHKSISAGMESPLMVNVDYHDGHPYPRTHSLFPPREATWAWEDLRFTLVEHQYDDFMVLTVDRLALEAAEPLDQPDGAPPPPTEDSAKPVMSE